MRKVANFSGEKIRIVWRFLCARMEDEQILQVIIPHTFRAKVKDDLAPNRPTYYKSETCHENGPLSAQTIYNNKCTR